ncbi:hypothetical protein ALC56_14282 [Trachymyrmex septentrionalis]|uniref:Uncharacterized protein n=1 Tax=Trachymyrmex septentrionalis TaxID=34720 RepID=A0A195ETB5_9HYME|nr:hypothetical protein ALC56_14282 [Trachymyrmex septentrionalis]
MGTWKNSRHQSPAARRFLIREDARNRSRKDAAKHRSDETRSQNDHGVIDNRNRTGDDPSVRRRELERKRSVLPPVSFRLPDRKRSEKNTNSPRFLQAVSRFVDARKKFVTKAGRVRT